MMQPTARIIPFMRRRTDTEFARRSSEVSRAAVLWCLPPLYIVQATWLTIIGVSEGGDK